MLIQCYYPGSFGIVVIFGKSVTLGRPFPLHIGNKSVPLVVDTNIINRKHHAFSSVYFSFNSDRIIFIAASFTPSSLR